MRSVDSEYPHFIKYNTKMGGIISIENLKYDVKERIKYSEWLRTVYPKMIQNVCAYTDGGATANGSADCKSTWGYVIVEKTDSMLPIKQDCGLVDGKQSNNCGELSGVLELLKNLEPYRRVTIYVDSLYVKNVLLSFTPSNYDGTRQIEKGWNPKENLHLIEQIKPYLYYVNAWHHVKGHSGDKYNSMADSLCNLAKTLSTTSIKPDILED
jgi:ribonuclease HI